MPTAQLGFRSHRQMPAMAPHMSSFRPCCLSVACSIRSAVDLPSVSQNSTHMHYFFCAVSNHQMPFPAPACVSTPRVQFFFPVEFLHCSQCVSQYLSVCHHTSQRTLPRCEVTSLHSFGREHLNMHPADLDFSMNTSSHKRKLEPAVYRSNNKGESATQNHRNCGTTQQGALDNTESTRARATVKSLP